MKLEQLKQMHAAGKLIGIFEGISNDDYHAGPGESSTRLKDANQSMAHYLEGKTAPHDPTPAMLLGTYAHTHILEGEKVFNSRYFVMPEGKTRASADVKAAMAADPNRESVSFKEYQAVLGMQNAIDSHPIAKQLLIGKKEVAAYWIDPATKLLCKAKSDCLRSDGMIVDLKTTTDASSDGFPIGCARNDYPLSAAFYLDGFRQAIEQSCNDLVQIPDAFVFLAIEKQSPYGISCFVISAEDLAKGRLKYERALARIKEYNSSKKKGYCGYFPQIQTLNFPAWA